MEQPNLKPHNLILENRQSLSLSGVTDVESFNDTEISLYTSMGDLVVRGKNLHVEAINLDTGDMSISGEIKSMVYGDKNRTKKLSLWGKVKR